MQDMGSKERKSEVIAVDVVEEQTGEDFHLLIAVAMAEKSQIEGEESNMSYSLRIYGNDKPAKSYLEQALFAIEDSCQIISLSNPPMQISHLKKAAGGFFIGINRRDNTPVHSGRRVATVYRDTIR
ncbi:hypothetical protein DFQ28_009569 [Apophysomyces sp. BC1034]|nr:hypothetical protein DFQ28_009569 [Apophysomyces sp. BC1034]